MGGGGGAGTRRRGAGSEGYGLAKTTVLRGREELAGGAMEPGRVRRPGAGRKNMAVVDPGLLIAAMENLVEPATRGAPQSPLRWTSKSTHHLARELTAQGHRISHTRVGQLLQAQGYSLQANRKTKEGSSHPDRNAQFQHINTQVKAQLAAGEAAISVDTKKKELIGDFRNSGREWHPKGKPQEVGVGDGPSTIAALLLAADWRGFWASRPCS